MSSSRVGLLLFTIAVASLPAVGCSSASSPQTGMGGSAGVGGSGGNAGGCLTDQMDLIADFMTDNGIHPADGRQGGWYVYGDDNGTFTPPKMGNAPYPIDTAVGGPCSGPGSFHVNATGFNVWGAAVATDFKPTVGVVKSPYDATKYKGISFWAKAATKLSGVQVKFPDLNTDPEVMTPKCVLVSGSARNCSPYLVKLGGDPMFATYPDTIGPTWKQFNVLFADAKQDQYNPGYQPADNKLDVANLLGVAVQVNANFSTNPVSANDFEIWIDDVVFIKS